MLNQNYFSLSKPSFVLTENDSGNHIIKIKLTMQENYHELSKCVGEMTISIPHTGHPEISITNLQDYEQVLTRLLKNHTRDYGCEGK